MAQRLTWQNVDAPDLRTALAARQSAGEMLAAGANSIGSALGSLDYRNRSKASNAAMNAALAYQDADAWDELMRNGGLAALGVAPSRATDGLMNFVQGYRDTLTKRAEGDYNFDRQQVLDDRADLSFERSEEDRARKLQALEIARDISRNNYTAEEAQRDLLNRKLEDPRLEADVMAALGQQPDARFRPSAEALGAAGGMAESQIITEQLDAWDRELNIRYGSDDATRLWSEGVERYSGYNSPVEGLIANTRGFADPGDFEGEGETTFNRSVGEIDKAFDALNKKYDLPPELIASVMENNLKATGIGWMFDGKRKFDTGAIEKQLDLLNSPEKRAALEQNRAAIQREQTAINSYRTRLATAQQRYALAQTRGASPAALEEMRSTIVGLQSELARAVEGRTPPSAPQPNPNPAPAPTPAPGSAQAATTPAPAPTPNPHPEGAVDPRITAAGEQISNARQTGSQIWQSLVQQLDRRLTAPVATTLDIANFGSRARAYSQADSNPEAASEQLRLTDQWSRQIDQMRENGILPSAESLRPEGLSPEALANAVPAERRGPQVSAGEMANRIGYSAGMNPDQRAEASQLASVIQQGVNPQTGQALSPSERAGLIQQLRQLFAAGGDRAQGAVERLIGEITSGG